MYYEEYHTRRIGVAYCDPNYVHPEQAAEIFGRLVIEGLMTNDLHPDTAEKWATKAAHYGRIALTDREVQDAGWAAIDKIVEGFDAHH